MRSFWNKLRRCIRCQDFAAYSPHFLQILMRQMLTKRRHTINYIYLIGSHLFELKYLRWKGKNADFRHAVLNSLAWIKYWNSLNSFHQPQFKWIQKCRQNSLNHSQLSVVYSKDNMRRKAFRCISQVCDSMEFSSNCYSSRERIAYTFSDSNFHKFETFHTLRSISKDCYCQWQKNKRKKQ